LAAFSCCRSLRCCSFWRFLKVCGPRLGMGVSSLRNEKKWPSPRPARRSSRHKRNHALASSANYDCQVGLNANS
jgi:hypothetical protein